VYTNNWWSYLLVRHGAYAVSAHSAVHTRLFIKYKAIHQGKKKVKADIALHGDPISELRDVTCHMGSHSVTCHPTQVNAPRLTPAMQAGTRFAYPGGIEGWVDLVDLIAPRPGSAPAGNRTSDLSITSPTPNRCTTRTRGHVTYTALQCKNPRYNHSPPYKSPNPNRHSNFYADICAWFCPGLIKGFFSTYRQLWTAPVLFGYFFCLCCYISVM